MSRRYPTAELYEERERDFYRNGNRSDRNYEELDFELRRSGVGGDPRRSMPDFLREDYNRPTAGPLVMRGRDDDSFSRSGPRSARGFDDDVRSTRSRPPPPASSVREVERDDITIRRREQSRGPPERDDIVFRRGDGPPVRSVSRPAPRQVDDDEVRFRGRTSDDIDIRASRSEVSRHGRDVSAERGSIRFQEKDGNFEIRANRREFSRDGRDTSRERSSLTIRGRERSLPPPARNRGELVAREREEFVIRRPRAESPPQNNREVVRDEIIIRRKEERAPTPSPSPSPPPPPPPPAPEPEIRPPIIQEIITHHRHIDHGKLCAPARYRFGANCFAGVVRARSPTPPPPPAPPSPPPPLNETLEIEINRREYVCHLNTPHTSANTRLEATAVDAEGAPSTSLTLISTSTISMYVTQVLASAKSIPLTVTTRAPSSNARRTCGPKSPRIWSSGRPSTQWATHARKQMTSSM